MVHRAGVSKGEHVLVTGASGGVGSAVVQLAKRRGAQVTAVVGKNKMDVLMEIGADRVIERNSDLVEVLGEKSVDVVVDNVAGEGFTQMSVVMKRGGRYASSGAIAGPIVTLDMRSFYLKDLTFIGCTAWDEPVFPNLVSYIERGEIKPMLARTYPLEDIVTAQKDFSEKKHVGKIVLLPPEQTPPQQDFIDSLKQ
ncbi:zinc-binding dehydrogenase [Alteromonas mediterranea]|uniref:Oxidoreductase n=2 Tax=Alteromonas mediterranea TaxID=314275 RepID=F2G620_ALTMD|nr:zinc-binding dehydrogenase [Alteromonas mediterranea]AEA98538.1 oxidoreductase [Alteromonas mediterranea DE]